MSGIILGGSGMYRSFLINNIEYASWGNPNGVVPNPLDIQNYNGSVINPKDTVFFGQLGDGSIGLGDSIWIINYLRDIYSIKCQRRSSLTICTSSYLLDFWSLFLPKDLILKEQFIKKDDFLKYNHYLPSIYHFGENKYNSDKSWVDGKSMLERLYNITGMQYDGLLDWADFTPTKILHPDIGRYGLDKNDRYIVYQYHTSGNIKSLSTFANIKLLNHLSKYGFKIIVIGRLQGLDILNNIKGVVNLSGKMEGKPEELFGLIYNSEFVVCPDSACLHIAEAYRIPCVCILSSLPPSYIASKYKIPSFMYGSGDCQHYPCGVTIRKKDGICQNNLKYGCSLLNDIDLDLFDRCIKLTFKNRLLYRSTNTLDFYNIGSPTNPI